jgi:TonB family protein
MNMKSKLTLGLGLIAVPLALHATSLERAYIESYHNHDAEPVPTSITTPTVDSRFVGQEFTLAFVIDPAGKPTHITSATPNTNPQLVASVTEAVEWWKFTPAYRNGKPVPRKVELPVSIVAASRGNALLY